MIPGYLSWEEAVNWEWGFGVENWAPSEPKPTFDFRGYKDKSSK